VSIAILTASAVVFAERDFAEAEEVEAGTTGQNKKQQKSN